MKVSILAVLAGVSISSVMPVALAADHPTRAVAYVNPDMGAATENGDVDPGSGCEMPDRRDRQALSTPGTSDRNVHVDACLFSGDEGSFDGTVTFESKGAGFISACPDPDQVIAQLPQVMNGERVAYLHDHNDDGRNEHCHQTGYQAKDAAGDDEYHVRLNNDDAAGRQKVSFCFDPEQDPASEASDQPDGHGCADTDLKSKVMIRWVE